MLALCKNFSCAFSGTWFHKSGIQREPGVANALSQSSLIQMFPPMGRRNLRKLD